MAKREGRNGGDTDPVQEGGDYDPSEGAQPRPANEGVGPSTPTGDSSLVYGGTGGEMSGKYGNNFVNMQAYLQANSGAQNLRFGHPSPTGMERYEPNAEYTQGMSQLDQSLYPFATRSDQPAQQPAEPGAGGLVGAATRHPEPPGPVYDPGRPTGGAAGAGTGRPANPTGPVYDPGPPGLGGGIQPHHTGVQALRQGFQPPDFSGGNYAAMGQQMANQKQPGGGY